MNIKKFYEDTNSNYQGALSIMMNDFLIERDFDEYQPSKSITQLYEEWHAKSDAEKKAAVNTTT